jgi:hypothetical protein
MATAQVIGLPEAQEATELTVEDVRDAHDAWLRGERLNREVRVRATWPGFTCVLYENGNPVAVERGTTWDTAVEHALQEVGAL